MTEPVFLTLGEVLAIQADQIERYGGKLGVRDMAGLESALAMPASGIRDEYFHRDLFEMAAAYLFHLCRNHPFLDGNKRVALVAALVFLDLNGIEVSAPEEETAELVLRVAEGKLDKPEITTYLRKHSR